MYIINIEVCSSVYILIYYAAIICVTIIKAMAMQVAIYTQLRILASLFL